MITRVLLVFHADGRLYFSTQAPEAFKDADLWTRKGYKVKDMMLKL